MEYIYVFFVASLLINLFFVFYCRFLLKNLVALSESSKDMRTVFLGFGDHVKSLYELEMFYGDETLKSMIDHCKFVVEQINTYEEALDLTEQKESEEERSSAKKEEE